MEKLSAWLALPENSAADLGARVGVSHVSVWRWAKGERQVSPENAIKVEQATAGAVTRSDLRPDLWSAAEAAA